MKTNASQSKWVKCPLCRKATKTKIFSDTVVINFPLYCPSCKREIPVTIIKEELKIIRPHE